MTRPSSALPAVLAGDLSAVWPARGFAASKQPAAGSFLVWLAAAWLALFVWIGLRHWDAIVAEASVETAEWGSR